MSDKFALRARASKWERDALFCLQEHFLAVVTVQESVFLGLEDPSRCLSLAHGGNSLLSKVCSPRY
jgi:hypothetical protein